MGVSIGSRIRRIRKNKGMMAKELAEKTGVSTKTISNYERNNTKPNRDRLYALAAALDVPLSALVGRAEQSAPGRPTPERPAESLYSIVNRMCDGRKCENCVISQGNAEPPNELCAIIAQGFDLEATVAAIRRWGAENPPAYKPTYRDDFFRKHPDAPRREDGAPQLPVSYVYAVDTARLAEFKSLTRLQQWDRPLGYWA